MPGPRPVIYFDACIFISMLTGEHRPDNESAEVAGLALVIEKKDIIVVTSTITRVEVLECKLDEQQTKTMKSLLRPPKIQVKEASAPIMDLAHEIRDYYQRQRDDGLTNLPTIETPDAIHLATAIHYECGALYTFDQKDIPEGKSRPKRSIISLNGIVAGRYPMVITKPVVESLGFSFGGPE